MHTSQPLSHPLSQHIKFVKTAIAFSHSLFPQIPKHRSLSLSLSLSLSTFSQLSLLFGTTNPLFSTLPISISSSKMILLVVVDSFSLSTFSQLSLLSETTNPLFSTLPISISSSKMILLVVVDDLSLSLSFFAFDQFVWFICQKIWLNKQVLIQQYKP